MKRSSHRSYYTLTILFLLFSYGVSNGQESLSQIMSSGNHFDKMCKSADNYFALKRPGKTYAEPTEGEYRDGEFVKYMRWRSFWEHSLNPDGTLGDISA